VYAFQESSDVPKGIVVGPRSKPWGTGHAVLAARNAVRQPFAVINADDFYGASGYEQLGRHFATSRNYALVGYPLKQTLSEHGTVSRGLCSTDAGGKLEKITELTKIEKTATGARYVDAAGGEQKLRGDEIVSMNFWGFTPAVFPQLDQLFQNFLHSRGQDPKAEFYLPTALSELNENRLAKIDLLRSTDAWFGITYREDLPTAKAAIRALVAAGRYPEKL
jgi:UTP-glucose-1-phosphate uridylyltransferase